MGAFSKLVGYNFAIMLAKPFENWDAYKLGVIDENGDIVKKPTTTEEKNSIDVMENLVRKIKKILLKYLPSPKLLTFLISAYLLKAESMSSENDHIINEINDILSDTESKMLYTILTTCNKF